MADLILLGDSHLSRVRRARLRRLEAAAGCRVVNLAAGGSSGLDLVGQLAPGLEGGVALVSVGTNDAAPWKEVPLDDFSAALASFLPRVPAARVVYVGPPGVDERRLTRARDRTNARLREYAEAAAAVVRGHAGSFLDTQQLFAGSGTDVFEDDGVHLNKAGYDVLLASLALLARP